MSGRGETPASSADAEAEASLRDAEAEPVSPAEFDRAQRFGSLSAPAKVEFLSERIRELHERFLVHLQEEKDRVLRERSAHVDPNELARLRRTEVDHARVRQSRAALKLAGAVTAVAMVVGSGLISAFAASTGTWQLSAYAAGWGLVAVGGLVQMMLAAFG